MKGNDDMADNKVKIDADVKVSTNTSGIDEANKKVKELLDNIQKVNLADSKGPKHIYYDTETTGVGPKDVPVTFAAYKNGNALGLPEINVYLDYGGKEKSKDARWEINKQNLAKAMNIGLNSATGKGTLIDSARELRKALGLENILGLIDFNNNEEIKALENIVRQNFESKAVTPQKLMELLKPLVKDGSKMVGFNSISFDTPMLLKFFETTGSTKGNSNFNKVFGKKNQIDARKLVFESMGENMATSRSQYVKGAFNLLGLMKLIRGSSSSGAHNADSDVMDTKLLFEALLTQEGKDLFGNIASIRDRLVSELKIKNKGNRNSNEFNTLITTIVDELAKDKKITYEEIKEKVIELLKQSGQKNMRFSRPNIQTGPKTTVSGKSRSPRTGEMADIITPEQRPGRKVAVVPIEEVKKIEDKKDRPKPVTKEEIAKEEKDRKAELFKKDRMEYYRQEYKVPKGVTDPKLYQKMVEELDKIPVPIYSEEIKKKASKRPRAINDAIKNTQKKVEAENLSVDELDESTLQSIFVNVYFKKILDNLRKTYLSKSKTKLDGFYYSTNGYDAFRGDDGKWVYGSHTLDGKIRPNVSIKLADERLEAPISKDLSKTLGLTGKNVNNLTLFQIEKVLSGLSKITTEADEFSGLMDNLITERDKTREAMNKLPIGEERAKLATKLTSMNEEIESKQKTIDLRAEASLLMGKLTDAFVDGVRYTFEGDTILKRLFAKDYSQKEEYVYRGKELADRETGELPKEILPFKDKTPAAGMLRRRLLEEGFEDPENERFTSEQMRDYGLGWDPSTGKYVPLDLIPRILVYPGRQEPRPMETGLVVYGDNGLPDPKASNEEIQAQRRYVDLQYESKIKLDEQEAERLLLYREAFEEFFSNINQQNAGENAYDKNTLLAYIQGMVEDFGMEKATALVQELMELIAKLAREIANKDGDENFGNGQAGLVGRDANGRLYQEYDVNSDPENRVYSEEPDFDDPDYLASRVESTKQDVIDAAKELKEAEKRLEEDSKKTQISLDSYVSFIKSAIKKLEELKKNLQDNNAIEIINKEIDIFNQKLIDWNNGLAKLSAIASGEKQENMFAREVERGYLDDPNHLANAFSNMLMLSQSAYLGFNSYADSTGMPIENVIRQSLAGADDEFNENLKASGPFLKDFSEMLKEWVRVTKAIIESDGTTLDNKEEYLALLDSGNYSLIINKLMVDELSFALDRLLGLMYHMGEYLEGANSHGSDKLGEILGVTKLLFDATSGENRVSVEGYGLGEKIDDSTVKLDSGELINIVKENLEVRPLALIFADFMQRVVHEAFAIGEKSINYDDDSIEQWNEQDERKKAVLGDKPYFPQGEDFKFLSPKMRNLQNSKGIPYLSLFGTTDLGEAIEIAQQRVVDKLAILNDKGVNTLRNNAIKLLESYSKLKSEAEKIIEEIKDFYGYEISKNGTTKIKWENGNPFDGKKETDEIRFAEATKVLKKINGSDILGKIRIAEEFLAEIGEDRTQLENEIDVLLETIEFMKEKYIWDNTKVTENGEVVKASLPKHGKFKPNSYRYPVIKEPEDFHLRENIETVNNMYLNEKLIDKQILEEMKKRKEKAEERQKKKERYEKLKNTYRKKETDDEISDGLNDEDIAKLEQYEKEIERLNIDIKKLNSERRRLEKKKTKTKGEKGRRQTEGKIKKKEEAIERNRNELDGYLDKYTTILDRRDFTETYNIDKFNARNEKAWRKGYTLRLGNQPTDEGKTFEASVMIDDLTMLMNNSSTALKGIEKYITQGGRIDDELVEIVRFYSHRYLQYLHLLDWIKKQEEIRLKAVKDFAPIKEGKEIETDDYISSTKQQDMGLDYEDYFDYHNLPKQDVSGYEDDYLERQMFRNNKNKPVVNKKEKKENIPIVSETPEKPLEKVTEAVAKENRELEKGSNEVIPKHVAEIKKETEAEANKIIVSRQLSETLGKENAEFDNLSDGSLPFTIDGEKVFPSESDKAGGNYNQLGEIIGKLLKNALMPLVNELKLQRTKNYYEEDSDDSYAGLPFGVDVLGLDEFLKYYKLRSESSLKEDILLKRLGIARDNNNIEEVTVLEQMLRDLQETTKRWVDAINSKLPKNMSEGEFIEQMRSQSGGPNGFGAKLDLIDRDIGSKIGEEYIKLLEASMKQIKGNITEIDKAITQWYNSLKKIVELNREILGLLNKINESDGTEKTYYELLKKLKETELKEEERKRDEANNVYNSSPNVTNEQLQRRDYLNTTLQNEAAVYLFKDALTYEQQFQKQATEAIKEYIEAYKQLLTLEEKRVLIENKLNNTEDETDKRYFDYQLRLIDADIEKQKERQNPYKQIQGNLSWDEANAVLRLVSAIETDFNADKAYREKQEQEKERLAQEKALATQRKKAVEEVVLTYEDLLKAVKAVKTIEEEIRTQGDKLYKTDDKGNATGKYNELGEKYQLRLNLAKQLQEIARQKASKVVESYYGENGKNKDLLTDEDKVDISQLRREIALNHELALSQKEVTEARKRLNELNKKAKDNAQLSEDKLKNDLMNQYLNTLKKINDLEVKINRNKNDMGRVSTKDRRELEKANKGYEELLVLLYGELPNYDENNGTFTIGKGDKQKQIKLSDEENTKFIQELANLENRKNESIARTNAQLTRQKGILEQLTNSFKEELNSIFNYQIGNRIFNEFENAIRNVIEYTKQLDANMVDLLIASGESYNNIYDLTKQFNELGNELGRTTSEVMLAANDWLRAGYDSKEAAELTRASMNLSTLGMINSSDATSYLISMLKGWKLETEEVNAVVDRLVAVDMSAALSAGELAEGLSRANTSAQLAGSTMDNFIGYVTTIADVSQKSASSVGESMKTLYARFLNAAAGKFAATQEEIDSGNYNEDEYSNINDIETAAGAVGIRIRDSIDHFRNFDDVLAEVASKWDTFSNVQQAGLATSFAGVRLRENFILLMENFDAVSRYARIAEESAGTAQQKMLAYTDSIEAAKNRTTTALEQLALDFNIGDKIKAFYDVITYLTENMGKLLLVIGSILTVTNGKDMARGLGNGFISLSNTALSGGNVINGIFGVGGGLGGTISNAWDDFREQVYQEEFSKVTTKYKNQLGKAFPRLSEGSFGVLEGFKNKSMGLTQDSFDLISKLNFDLKSLISSSAFDSIEDTLKKLITELANTADSVDDLNNDGIKKLLQLGQDEKQETGKIENDLAIAQRIGSTVGMGFGAFAGFELGEKAHEGFGTIGTMIGSAVGAYAGGEVIKGIVAAVQAKGNGTTIAAALKSAIANPALAITATLITALATVWAINEKQKKDFLQELENNYKKSQEEYNEALNVSALVAEYDELVEGVDSLGRNVSLTNEDYLRFLEISLNLAETFPSLESRVNSAGDTFVLNGGKVGKMTEAVDELTESLKEQRDLDLLNSKVMGIDGEEISLMQRDLEGVKEAKKKLDAQDNVEKDLVTEWFKKNGIEGVEVEYGQKEGAMGAYETDYNTVASVNIEKTRQKLEKQIADTNKKLEMADREIAEGFVFGEAEKEKLQKELEEYQTALNILNEKSNEAWDYAKKENMKNRKEIEEEYNKTVKVITDYSNAIINTTPKLKSAYENMSEEAKAAVDHLNSNLELSGDESDADVAAMIQENVETINNLIEEYPEFEKSLKLAYNLEPDIKIGEYTESREAFKNRIINDLNIPDNIKKEILVALQFDFTYDEKGERVWFDKNNPWESIERDGLETYLDEGVATKIKSNYGYSDTSALFDYLTSLKEAGSGVVYTYDEINLKLAEIQYGSSSSIEEIIKGYEVLKERSKNGLTDIEKAQDKIIKDQLTEWKEKTGVVADSYDKVVSKAKLIGDLTDVGTVEGTTLSQVIEEGSKYKEYLEFLNNDFNGDWGSNPKIYAEMLEDINLSDFIIAGDTEGLKNEIIDILDTLLKKGDDVYQNSLLKSETAYKEFLSDSGEFINGLNELYKTDLTQYKTMEEAKIAINNSVIETLGGGWEEWRLNLLNIYRVNAEGFGYYAGLIISFNNILFNSLKGSADSAGINLGLMDETAFNESRKASRRYDKDADILKYKNYEAYIESQRDTLISKKTEKEMDELNAKYEEWLNKNKSAPLFTSKKDSSKSGSGSSGSSDNLPDEKYKPSDYLETMESLINKEWEAMEVFDELTGKPKVIDVLVDDYGVKEFFDTYMKQVSEAKDKATIDKAYKNLQEAAGKAGISVEQLNEAIANNNIESVLGSKEVELQTKYFDKMRESIQKRLEQLRKDIEQSEKDYEALQAKADSYGDQKTKEAIEARNEAGDAYKELVDYQKQEIELQVQLNNLDDEQVQDEISLAEAKNASLKTLIKLNQQLLWTADTEEERVQHNKTILDLLKQQYEEAKRVREFYQGYAERTKNVYSGTAWSNSTDYDTMQKYQFAYNEKNAQAILAERDRRFSIRYDELMDEGIYSEAEAKKLAMEDEEVLSLTEEYLDTIDKRAEIIYQGIEDKTDELDRKLDLIDKGRPKEWTNISLIQASYNTETAVLIEKLNVLNQGLAQAAYLTDELILNMVDEINDARIKLQEGNIALAEAIKGLQEKQFDAVKSKVEDYKNDLLDLIDAIEEAYKKELEPIERNNLERERAIELEEKLNAIKNKEKEKERVYRQGKNKILCPV